VFRFPAHRWLLDRGRGTHITRIRCRDTVAAWRLIRRAGSVARKERGITGGPSRGTLHCYLHVGSGDDVLPLSEDVL